MTPVRERRKLWLALGGILIALLLAAVFTLGSLNIPFEPDSLSEIILLYALSTFIVAALLVFGLVLTRSFLRLWAERRAGQLGARFKTKMVFGAMGISLLPVLFMFFISYALLNRTLAKWFPRPLEIATEQSQQLLADLGRLEHRRLGIIGGWAVQQDGLGNTPEARGDGELAIQMAMQSGADAAWTVSSQGAIEAGVGRGAQPITRGHDVVVLDLARTPPRFVRKLPSGAELWAVNNNELVLGARKPLANGKGELVVARALPSSFAEQYRAIEAQVATYEAQKQGLRAFKTQMLLTLLLFTVLLLFSATWFALFLSKQVTVPIQALAEATREVSGGKFDHRVDVQAQDELGILVASFNQMTAQLGDSRAQINEFTRSLQQAVEELERRRKVMEAILENIPTGVLSLDESGAIRRANPAVARIFGERGRTAQSITELVGPEASRGVELLMRKSLRMGVASKELEISLPERVLHAAVTVSSLGPRRANPGFIVVVDDLTELLRAQKTAAWQEVAQRIAHEIKNPLTPIQLSAQRLTKQIEKFRPEAAQPGMAVPHELSAMVGECAALIEREVSALKAMVDEFSEFARFPTPKPVSVDMNSLVSSALDVFSGRLEGIRVKPELAPALPAIKADPELLRRVLVNLIDNAAEAMEGSTMKELRVATRLEAEGDAVEITVADSGHGISPEDKDKLFLPHFSTKHRGTGLGLAIVGRIVAEHGGTIRVEDNQPVGARFVIRLPLAEVPAAQRANGQV
jgi:PAS domain S-box-containing protein